MPLNLIGNARALQVLRRSLASGSPPHSYLFSGPERAGKRTAALWLAQALNCASPAGAAGMREPCGRCSACARIASANHPDIVMLGLEPAPAGEMRTAISVEQVREAAAMAALNPYEGRTRVFIFDPAGRMTEEAQNALLKMLEEPPPHVVFVLVAAQDGRLLPTVRSRCQPVEFRLAPVGEIEEALRARGLAAQQAQLLARLSRGRPGWALAMAEDDSLLARRRSLLEQARSLHRLSMAQRFALSEALAADFRKDRESVFAVLAEWQGWWRDVLLVQADAQDGAANIDLLDALREDAAAYSRDQLLRFLRALSAAAEHLRSNVQARIALDALLLEAPRRRAGSPVA
jgi:DNA polymerase-3 subunit delta'